MPTDYPTALGDTVATAAKYWKVLLVGDQPTKEAQL